MSDFDPLLFEDMKQIIVKVRPHQFGITASELAEAFGITWQTAHNKLQAKENSGELKSEFMRSGGKTVRVYFKA